MIRTLAAAVLLAGLGAPALAVVPAKADTGAGAALVRIGHTHAGKKTPETPKPPRALRPGAPAADVEREIGRHHGVG